MWSEQMDLICIHLNWFSPVLRVQLWLDNSGQMLMPGLNRLTVDCLSAWEDSSSCFLIKHKTFLNSVFFPEHYVWCYTSISLQSNKWRFYSWIIVTVVHTYRGVFVHAWTCMWIFTVLAENRLWDLYIFFNQTGHQSSKWCDAMRMYWQALTDGWLTTNDYLRWQVFLDPKVNLWEFYLVCSARKIRQSERK